jgi:hypothetical protein
MVIDRAGILDDRQETSAINDAWRLNQIGIPAQVVTELAGLDQDQASRRATELRLSHRIESRNGADDGLLIYAAVNANNRTSITMAISYGTNAVPNNGLTAATTQRTVESVMEPQLLEQRPARAIVYSLREIMYLQQYMPPAMSPLTGSRQMLHRALPFAAPIMAMTAVALVAIASGTTRRSRMWTWLAAGAALTGLLAVAGVAGRSTLAIGLTVALIALLAWRVITLDVPSASVSPRRTLRASPRPPVALLHRATRRSR